jgi:(2Fe-2S) ferredoxin
MLRPVWRRRPAPLSQGAHKELGIAGEGGVRINSAGCLARCDEGPVMVVYPEAVWYTYVDREDLEEILRRHLLEGRVVDRLRLPG